jgi:putative molybdopterin biosynthesis protein
VQKVFLSNMELSEAIDFYLNKIHPIKTEVEVINTWEGRGRISYSPVYAKLSSPFYNSSAMDGIATLSAKTYGAHERNHIELQKDIDYIVVDTGDPIPRVYDCVIMVEDLINIGSSRGSGESDSDSDNGNGNGDNGRVNDNQDRVAIYKGAAPWQNIRPLGEDIVETQLIIPSAQEIRPVDIGAMLAGGINKLEVYKKPLVGIIPTGTEMVEPGSELKIGDIIEFNSRVFSAQVEEWGGTAKRYDILKDDYELIKETVKKASEECDIVLVNAGSSAGREDFTYSVIEELGEVYIHGVAIKPGKPVILGSVNGKPVIGIPGFPVSAYFVMENICKPVIKASLGLAPNSKPFKEVGAILSRRVMSSLKYLEFVRMKLGYVGDKIIATPISRGAGATMSLVKADGYLEIPQSIEGYEAGTEVRIKLLKDESDLYNTIVCIGSHDPILDIAADLLHVESKKYYLSSAHVGSMGGIMALKSTETHIAPIHLLDMENGEYNTSYIKKYLPQKEIALIKGVKRIQGLMVQKGNPLGIKSLSDISASGASYVNRQKGSGTRLFLDYQLGKLGISSKDIYGYEREEFTHLSVAAAISAKDADAGMGIYSAAMLMGLDFIPLGNEEYDFAIPKEYLELEMIKEFIEILQSDSFKQKLDELGGYDYSDIGRIITDGSKAYER